MSGYKPDKESFVSWNEEMIRKYDPDKYHNHESLIIRTVEKMRRRAVRKLCGEEAGEVVDIGCGAGNFIPHFDGFRYIGIDISEYILGEAAGRLRENAFLIRASAEELPLKDKSARCIICSEVIEHVLDPAALATEAGRALADDGIAVFSIPNEKLINLLKRIIPWIGASKKGYSAPRRMDDEWHLTALDSRLFREIIKGKFRIEKQIGVPSAFMPLRYVFRLRKI
ncbi:MAG: class I SAM-dependent methyltransferase [bacterium]